MGCSSIIWCRDFSFLLLSAREHEVREHGNAENDTVPAEHLEVVLLDERHQHPDDEHGRDKCRYHADREDDQLGLRECQAELDQLEQARAEHDRNGEEEREFRRHRARHADADFCRKGKVAGLLCFYYLWTYPRGSYLTSAPHIILFRNVSKKM